MQHPPIRIAINGFGRIGRTILRQVLADPNCGIEIAHINDLTAAESCAYLFAYDSVFGPYPGQVSQSDGMLRVEGHAIPLTQTDDISSLDFADVDLVLECTGRADTVAVASRGLQAGAQRVLISGPSKAAEITVVLGANDAALTDQTLVSNASCTTNALAPLLHDLDAALGIVAAHMTTIHCYTGSQPMVDAPRGDLARSRAGALSMVPTTTSATKLVGQVLPHLADRITGAAVRVPVASVSAIDLTATLGAPIDHAQLVQVLRDIAAASPVIGLIDGPLVSSDLRSRPESLIIALPETIVTSPTQVRIFGWYDNEWGFSARMIDMARRMA